jgi:His-Xaa-Ser repeat protein HxsA
LPGPTTRGTLSTPPLPTGPVTPPPAPADLSMMVVRVQAALMRLGYHTGDIDGRLGPETREALKRYQRDHKLKETGRMDLETLTNLGIPVQ